MYSGDNPVPAIPPSAVSPGGFFPNFARPGERNFEPLNTGGYLADGKVYACPAASTAFTFAHYSNYRYRGSGLRDDNDSASAISIAYDQSGNHPDNQWMNALFIDGHVEGARPDGNKSWNHCD